MCMFSAPAIPRDNSAELARQREAQRQARISEGREKIDEAFSRFDDPFFAGVQKDFEDFSFPEIDDQFNTARRKVTLGLARSGNLNSGSGARTLGDLNERLQTERVNAANSALDQTQQFRQQIEGAKNDLFAQNITAADPASIAAQAASRAGTFAVAPAPSPIGQLFVDFINTAATGVAAERNGFRGFNTGLFSPKSDAVRVVGA